MVLSGSSCKFWSAWHCLCCGKAAHLSGICAGFTLRMVAALGLIDLFTAVVLMHNYRVLSSFATFITPEANKEKKVHGDLTRLVDRRNVKARPSHFASSGGARLGARATKQTLAERDVQLSLVQLSSPNVIVPAQT